MITQCAVMGNPIAHSLSPLIHSMFAEQTGIALEYKKILVEENEFEKAVDHFFSQGGKGLNITLPFKQRAFAMSNIKTERCSQAGAANTLWFSKDQLYADNTDGVGLITDLTRHTEVTNKKILILGAGGATRGIIQPLHSLSPRNITITNRTHSKTLALKEIFPFIIPHAIENLTATYDIIINATSFETNTDIFSPVLANHPYCYDLSYNTKTPTTFVKLAQEKNCKANDGLGMLIEQAAEAFQIWHGVRPKTEELRSTLISNIKHQ